MKKTILAVLLIAFFTTTYGQNKYHERQNKFYVEAAAEEFNLNQDQQKELSEFRMEMVKTYIANNKAKNEGEIQEEAMKKNNREASKNFNNALIKLTGKSYKELEPFLNRMRKELKSVK